MSGRFSDVCKVSDMGHDSEGRGVGEGGGREEGGRSTKSSQY